MLARIFFFLSVFLSAALSADDYGTLVFEDDFERNESQEKKEELTRGWGSNSKKRANGNKQVDLRDGAMYIYFHESADHAVSVTHPAEFRNGAIGMRFMLENPKDILGLNFADLQYKAVHAGHLFVARIGLNDISLQDLKTGSMDLKIREARTAKTLSAEQKKMLKQKQSKVKHQLEKGKWYDLVAGVEGDTLRILIDGQEVASFSSEGIAHPTKRMLRLSVPGQAVVDDVKIWRKE